MNTLTYTESELTNKIRKISQDITFQKAVMDVLAKQLDHVKNNRKEHEAFLAQKAKQEAYEKNRKKAEKIEIKISGYMKKHWEEFQFLYLSPVEKYDPSLIHTPASTSNAALPRKIMVYFINQYSKLSKSEISRYFGKSEGAAYVIHSMKAIDELCEVYHEFRKKIEEIKQILKTNI